MKRIKVCIVSSSRAEYSRQKTIIEAINNSDKLSTIFIAMGAHLLGRYGKTVTDIEKDGVKIAEKIYTHIEGENPVTMAKSTGLAIIELTSTFDNQNPDLVLVQGDRYEALAVSIAASFTNIPLGHVQGGEITGTIDESIRHAITKLSHYHFASNEESKHRIIKMGENPARVFNVGCPATDLLLRCKIKSREATLKEVQKKWTKEERQLHINQPYVLLLQHPVTTEFKHVGEQITETLKAISKLNMQVIMLYPNLDAGTEDMITSIRRFFINNPMENVLLYKNFPNELFINILANSSCIIGNSSSGIRESSYFGIPTVNIGTRQNGREGGANIINVSYNGQEILTAIRKQVKHGPYPVEKLYGDGTAGQKICRILEKINLSCVQKRINI